MAVRIRRTYAQVSDAELLSRTAEDAEAFGVFYDRHEAMMLGFFVRATRRGDLAADLTAEVFAAALASASGFRAELGTPRSWLFGIARHELADLWERGRVENRARRRLGLEPLGLTDEVIERIEQIDAERAGAGLELLLDPPGRPARGDRGPRARGT